MKKIMRNVMTALMVIVVTVLSIKIGTLPAMGRIICPFTGWLHNAKMSLMPEVSKPRGLKVNHLVEVHYDSSYVPHIFAQTDSDLYYMQGYIHAMDRLWQMEMQARSGMGTLCEVVGEVALPNDRLMRRVGLKAAAQTLIEQMKIDGTISVAEQYCKGVNDYIDQMDDRDVPIEYKLMGFSPQRYEPIHIAILLKIMSMRLTAMEADIENTNFVNKYGREMFDELYPNFYDEESPICPPGTSYSSPIESSDSNSQKISTKLYTHRVMEHLERALGSNNWAVHAEKSETGNALLADDPHLKLHLPSIWYELHLVSEEQNVYGASMPGAPGVVIGFNSNIAWGVTNAGRDVRNWYEIKYQDASRSHILVDGKAEATKYEIETIKIRGGDDIVDTTIVTSFGRVVYDRNFSPEPNPVDLALWWTHDLPSNEVLTFLKLNKAKNITDYLDALKTFYCPGQNFVYADIEGNIAIKQQGLFPLTNANFDKFVLDGTKSSQKVRNYIPIDQNPTSINPSRGYVSSANQHPTDRSYPYYYSSGDFEAYRNRRINQVLGAKEKMTIADMKNLQSDVYGMMASEFIPLLLSYTSSEHATYSPQQQKILKALSQWDYMYADTSVEATLADIWMKRYEALVWDELNSSKIAYDIPKPIMLYKLSKEKPNHKFFDIESTSKVEIASDIASMALKQAFDSFEFKQWWAYKETAIEHLAKIPSFGHYNLKTGGNKHIVNAIWKDWAPSWRMIVELKPKRPVAYICYPGGNSGNPASKYYDYQIKAWCQNQYRQIPLSYKPSEVETHHVIIVRP